MYCIGSLPLAMSFMEHMPYGQSVTVQDPVIMGLVPLMEK